ncbi:MAG: hypothetical protein IJR82_00235 [Bacilli bacterium]|nr:hypothetical protein [Bacilli bacterium]
MVRFQSGTPEEDKCLETKKIKAFFNLLGIMSVIKTNILTCIQMYATIASIKDGDIIYDYK